ncbi:MAG TPA: phosphoglycerate dehydrogenase [Thermoanaerobacterales bacterium]|nr:phosphoglycerate dehydrogenase [Thermoanaerobacterales bacterium]
MKNILITSKEFGKENWDELELLFKKFNINPIVSNLNLNRGMNSREICELANKYKIEGILVYSSSDEINRDVFKNCKDLKVISRHGVGVENIDLKAAEEYGVEVKTTKDLSDYKTVADLCFGLILSIARKITESNLKMKMNIWERPIGTDVWGKTLGIIGFGRIGRAVARRAKGFEMKVLSYDPYIDKESAIKEDVIMTSLHDLLVNSDFISLHIRLTDDTRNLIDMNELQIMKKTAFLINTSRAGVVNQKALINALRENIIAGAAIDVFDKEPAVNDPLILAKLDNLILTPHIGSYTRENLCAMNRKAVCNIADVLNR